MGIKLERGSEVRGEGLQQTPQPLRTQPRRHAELSPPVVTTRGPRLGWRAQEAKRDKVAEEVGGAESVKAG